MQRANSLTSVAPKYISDNFSREIKVVNSYIVQNRSIFTSFLPKRFDKFSREIKVEFLDQKWRYWTVCIFSLYSPIFLAFFYEFIFSFIFSAFQFYPVFLKSWNNLTILGQNNSTNPKRKVGSAIQPQKSEWYEIWEDNKCLSLLVGFSAFDAF